MGKIVGFDIGEASVKLAYFVGKELKKAVTADLPDAMVSDGRYSLHGRHGRLPPGDGQTQWDSPVRRGHDPQRGRRSSPGR